MDVINPSVLSKVKLKMLDLEEFKELGSEEQFMVINMVEAGIHLYLDILGELTINPGLPLN